MASMIYRPLGHSGTKVSLLGLGGWTTFGNTLTDPQTIREIFKTAFDGGINFFDTADVYAKGEAERIMGEQLQAFPRHELVLSSKVFFPISEDINDRGLSRKHIMESVHRTLRHLGTDYLDIYFCHRFDPETPLAETLRAMEDLIRQGKILYWGSSEWRAEQIRQAWEIAESRYLTPPQVEQPQYSLIARKKLEQSTLPVLQELGMGCVVWSPLGSGILTGKYDDGIPKGSRLDNIDWLQSEYFKDTYRDKVRQMKTVADEVGYSRAQLALAWAAARPGISSVITGATSAEQVQENMGALEISITDEILEKLNTLFPI